MMSLLVTTLCFLFVVFDQSQGNTSNINSEYIFTYDLISYGNKRFGQFQKWLQLTWLFSAHLSAFFRFLAHISYHRMSSIIQFPQSISTSTSSYCSISSCLRRPSIPIFRPLSLTSNIDVLYLYISLFPVACTGSSKSPILRKRSSVVFFCIQHTL